MNTKNSYYEVIKKHPKKCKNYHHIHLQSKNTQLYFLFYTAEGLYLYWNGADFQTFLGARLEEPCQKNNAK
jgi:hypothetical protein